MDKFVLLTRKSPTEYEIHAGEVNQTRNLLLTTKDKNLAEDVVNGYNQLQIRKEVESYPKGLGDKDISNRLNELGLSTPNYMMAVDHYKSFCK
jgi:hypothetical protein